jgi:2-dehydropantoate 2-reductase
MRIVMIGAGAMGSTFGAWLARAGADVALFDVDQAHIDAVVADGLRVETPAGEIRLRVPATSNLAGIPPADMAIVLVDSNATRSAAAALAEILPPTGVALTLQNGIGNVEALVAALGRSRVLGGTTYNSAARLAPARVRHSNIGETTIGEPDGRSSQRIATIAALFREAGLPIAVSDNVIGHIWMKFVLNVAINPVSAITGLRPGEIARTEPARRLLERTLDELLAVVAAKGIVLPDAEPRAAVLDHAFERYNRHPCSSISKRAARPRSTPSTAPSWPRRKVSASPVRSTKPSCSPSNRSRRGRRSAAPRPPSTKPRSRPRPGRSGRRDRIARLGMLRGSR